LRKGERKEVTLCEKGRVKQEEKTVKKRVKTWMRGMRNSTRGRE